MNADSCFYVGSSHKICQDYALHSNEGSIRAIVCDGCSSSPDTDIGARLLARAALMLATGEEIILHAAIAVARGWGRGLNLSRFALDSTLIVLQQVDNDVNAIVAGDGVVAARVRDSHKLEWFRIHFPSGAPFYPNYLNDPSRLEVYLRETEGKGIEQSYIDTTVKWASLPYRADGAISSYLFSGQCYDLIVAMSDGIESFMKTQSPIPFEDLVPRVLDIKGTKGEFITRRVNRMLKEIRRDGGQHTDDLGIAAIYIP